MKTKQEQTDEAWETYQAIAVPAQDAKDKAWEAYKAKCREIEEQEEE